MLQQEDGRSVRDAPNQFRQKLTAAEREKVEQGGLGFVLGNMSPDELGGAEEIPLFD